MKRAASGIMLSAVLGAIAAVAFSAETEESCPLEERMKRMGLVNVLEADPTLIVDVKYSGTGNFMGRDVYGCLEHCYLQPEAAAMLKRAHEYLTKYHPDYRLVIFDGARPLSVQEIMWSIVKDSPRRHYVVPPWIRSNHNYGAAVDCSVARLDSSAAGGCRLLDMGTEYDHLGVLAEPRHEERFVREKRLTREQVDNRRVLREAMVKAGFIMIPNEWWHFDAFSFRTIRTRYTLIE